MSTENPNDTEDFQEISDDDADAAFLKKFGPEDTADEPEDGDQDEDVEVVEVDEDEEVDGDEGDGEENEDDGEGDKTSVEFSDDHIVKLKVGDEVKEVPFKELREVFVQRDAVAARAQEADTKLTAAQAEAEKAVVVMDAMMKRAAERFRPYQNVDFAIAAQRLDEASYNQLKQDYQATYADVAFLQQEAQVLLETVRSGRNESLKAAMKACDEALAIDPDTKGWSAEARKEMSDYAVKAGLPAHIVESLVDPAAIKLIRKAMAYDRGTKAVAAKVVENGKIKAKIKVPVKPGSPTQGSSRDRTRNDAMARLRKTGSENDAEAAFLARFGG